MELGVLMGQPRRNVLIHKDFREAESDPESAFFTGSSRSESPERFRWLLGYSWIDPLYRVENSIKEVRLSPHVSLWKRWATCCYLIGFLTV